MKTFKDLRNTKKNLVSKKRVDGIHIGVEKMGNEFIAIVDGDRLDTYKSKAEAEKAALQFVKQFKAR